MENKTKMFICIGYIILIGIIYQIIYGKHQASLLILGFILFSIGFGWYACKAKSEDLQNKK